MAPPKKETQRQLLFAFQQELFGSAALFVLFWPMCSYLQNTFASWAYHFAMVMVFDIVTFGCSANPAVVLALFLAGRLDATSAMVRVAAELLVAFFAFPLLKVITPAWLMPSVIGPDVGAGVTTNGAFLAEMTMAYVFCFLVLVVTVWNTSPSYARPLFATVLRLLMISGGDMTGASFNPLVGLSWAFYTGRLFSGDYHLVYSLAPVVGGAAAAGAFVYLLAWTGAKVPKVAASKRAAAAAPTVPPSRVSARGAAKDTVAAEPARGRTPARAPPSKSPASAARSKTPTSRGRSGSTAARPTSSRPASASRGRSTSRGASSRKAKRA
jgi:glycerol uptake facilitator-like aquaporin